MKPGKLKDIVHRLLGITVAMLCMLGSSAVVYYISYRLLQYYKIELPMLAVQLINMAGGLILLFGTISILVLVTQRHQPHLFEEVREVFRQIGKGNFNVRLNRDPRRKLGHLEVLVDSVNEMTEKLKEMEAMRQEFISNVSHEIQSPLTSIRGFAQALGGESLTEEERRHYLRIIEMESTRLSRLSDNLLKLSSLESDFHRFQPSDFRLDKQLRNLVLACEPQWLEKGIEMELELTPATIRADEEMLSQVWVNLIHNSIKFTPSGGTITISLQLSPAEASVRIADTGIGITAEEQERIFERFYKADKSRNRESGGSGLGLSIVKKIVDTHKGTVKVQSSPGAGTQFTVTLPVGETSVPG